MRVSPARSRPLAALFAVLLGILPLFGPRLGPMPVDGPDAPRLQLREAHRIRAGQVVDLAWSPADSVRELELLFSTDGGRHFATWISPRLDPHARHFAWRVPPGRTRDLRLRVRYNLGGREIEGPPVALNGATREHDGTEPLALPVTSGGETPSRSGGRSTAPWNGARAWFEDDAAASDADRALSDTHHLPGPFANELRPRRLSACAAPRQPLRAPRFVPLRV